MGNTQGNTSTEGGDKGSGPSAEQYAQWAAQTAELAMQIKLAQEKKNALMAQSGCKVPGLLAGRKKKQEYLDCLAKNKARIEAAREADRALIRMQLEMRRLDALQNKGLSTGAWIGLSVGFVFLLMTAGIIFYKMNK